MRNIFNKVNTMNGARLLAAGIVLTLVFTTFGHTTEHLPRLVSQPGTKVKIEGKSTLHDWLVEGSIIDGAIGVGAGFPLESGQVIKPGKVEATVDILIPVTSLKSIGEDGQPFSSKMDELMYAKLHSSANPQIRYSLQELVLKGTPKSSADPYALHAKGTLDVAGVTNQISMSIEVLPLGGRKVKVSGTTAVKMSDFGIQKPGNSLMTVADDVSVSFEWVVGQ